MGGDDSQKLLPWRGIHSSPGRKPPAQLRINNVTETAGWNLALTPPSLAGLAVASATGRLGHFWKAHPGQFWRAPKASGPRRLASTPGPPLYSVLFATCHHRKPWFPSRAAPHPDAPDREGTSWCHTNACSPPGPPSITPHPCE